jgi:hypothetical protein
MANSHLWRRTLEMSHPAETTPPRKVRAAGTPERGR